MALSGSVECAWSSGTPSLSGPRSARKIFPPQSPQDFLNDATRMEWVINHLHKPGRPLEDYGNGETWNFDGGYLNLTDNTYPEESQQQEADDFFSDTGGTPPQAGTEQSTTTNDAEAGPSQAPTQAAPHTALHGAVLRLGGLGWGRCAHPGPLRRRIS